MSYLGEIYRWVRSKDGINPPSSGKLNFEGDVRQKTIIGGLVSLFVSGYVLYIAYTKGSIMVGLHNPYMSSLESTLDYVATGNVSLSELPLTLIDVLEYGTDFVDLFAPE